jgi:D-amino peptidase
VGIALVSGDQTLAQETREVLGESVETVIVKHAVGRFAARSVAPVEACRRIRDGAAAALKRPHRPFTLPSPIRLEVDFALAQMADMAELVPGSVRTGGRTVEYVHQDYREVFRAWRALYNLAGVE